MFKRESSSTVSSARKRPGWRLLVVPLVLWSWMACDTVAEITFRKESLKSVTVLGYRPDQCSATADDPFARCVGQGCGKLDFVLESTEGRFLTPNLQIVDLAGRLEPGVNFGNDSRDITFDRTWLFELDALGEDKDCTSDASVCSAPFTCQALTTQQLPSSSASVNVSRCVLEAQVTASVGSVTYTALGTDPQPGNPSTSGRGREGVALGLVLDNSGSLLGKSNNGTGQIVDGNQTDRQNRRIAALINFLGELLADGRSTIKNASRFGVFSLAGTSSAGVTDLFEIDPAFNETFVDSDAVTIQKIQQLPSVASGLTPVWEGLIEASAEFLGDDGPPSSYARDVLAVVDSDPDGSSESRTATQAIAALTEANARATIVHFDNPDRGDQEERTGPWADYARVACERGGYYLYELYPEALQSHLRRLGVAHEGVWSVDLQVTGIRGDGGVVEVGELPPGWYRLSAVMTVNIAGRTDNFALTLQESSSSFRSTTTDTRLLFHVASESN